MLQWKQDEWLLEGGRMETPHLPCHVETSSLCNPDGAHPAVEQAFEK